MLEDLFSVVKTRFNGNDSKNEEIKKSNIPSDLLNKCPRCGNVEFMEEFVKNKKFALPVTIMQGLQLVKVKLNH